MSEPKPAHGDGFAGLRRLWYTAIIAGLICAVAGALLAGYPGDGELILLIMSIAFGAAIFGGTFFIGANLAGETFESHVRDETKVRGASVDHITHVEAANDPMEQKWLDRYVWTRNLFGGLIIPLAIFAGLMIFS